MSEAGGKRPPDKAVALGYDAAKDPAPRVLAQGTGPLARKIIEIAKANGIPLYEDPDLTGLLLALDPGDYVPEDLYPAVAEVLVWLYNTGSLREIRGLGPTRRE